MSRSWEARYNHLSELLKVPYSPNTSGATSHVDVLGLALDKFAENVRQKGRSSRLNEVDTLRVTNKDFVAIGSLTKGQFGTINIVRCQFDQQLYVRKTVTKTTAIRYREQCSAQSERDILYRAWLTRCMWVPHLLCAFQTPTDLNFVMEFAEGGSLEGLLSSTTDGRVDQSDMLWWMPQAVAAIAWCHSQDFVHRDIKPQNFVLTAGAHLKLIDFGSAAPLERAGADGSQLVSKQYCRMPCGTVDYIAPEILQLYEGDLVALDLDESVRETDRYGREVDWWSLGAMMYELLSGQAPFFAEKVDETCRKIMNHHKFPPNPIAGVSNTCNHLIRGLLADKEVRLGRCSSDDVRQHELFRSVQWLILEKAPPPSDLYIPEFSYNPLRSRTPSADLSDHSSSGGFQFSAFFQSTPGASMLTAASPATPEQQEEERQRFSAFLGFTWGPTIDAFSLEARRSPRVPPSTANVAKRGSSRVPSTPHPVGILKKANLHQRHMSDPSDKLATYLTPLRPSVQFPVTIPRTGTVRRVREISEREALRQMIMSVGRSARKKVLESGKKPKTSIFDAFAPFPNLDVSAEKSTRSPEVPEQPPQQPRRIPSMSLAMKTPQNPLGLSTMTESTAPPSPSPRPGSAMSRRSGTPGPAPVSRNGTMLTHTMSEIGIRSGLSGVGGWSGFIDAESTPRGATATKERSLGLGLPSRARPAPTTLSPHQAPPIEYPSPPPRAREIHPNVVPRERIFMPLEVYDRLQERVQRLILEMHDLELEMEEARTQYQV